MEQGGREINLSGRYVPWLVLEGSPLCELGLLLAASRNRQPHKQWLKQIRYLFFLNKENSSGWQSGLCVIAQGTIGDRVPCVLVFHHP